MGAKTNMDYTYSATVERDEEGYFIDFPAFGGGVFSDGDTLKEAAPRAATALRLAIADYLDSGEPLPEDDLSSADMAFTVEVGEGFIKETRVDENLRGMSALQLRSLAALRGIEIESGATKTEIIDALSDSKPMGVESAPKDMTAALDLAKESKATVTLSLKLTIEEYLKLEIVAAGQCKSVDELLREYVAALVNKQPEV